MKIIDKLSLSELEALLRKHGCEVQAFPPEAQVIKQAPPPVMFSIKKVRRPALGLFILYCDGQGKTDPDNIEHFLIQAMFPSKKFITPEDINDINSRATRGRMSIQPSDTIAYSLWVSVAGGVTELHIDNELKFFIHAVDQCMEYIRLAETGVEKLKIELEAIFRPKKN